MLITGGLELHADFLPTLNIHRSGFPPNLRQSRVLISVILLVTLLTLVIFITSRGHVHIHRHLAEAEENQVRLSRSYSVQPPSVSNISHDTSIYEDAADAEPNIKTGFAFPLDEVPRIFYNRIPKCGSRSVQGVLTFLSQKHGFDTVESEVYNVERINVTEQAKFVSQFRNLPKKIIFDRHIHHINFKQFGQPQPIYINIIREPVGRASSVYYFRRFRDDLHIPMTDWRRNMTYDDCVQRRDNECTNPVAMTALTPYFCGQDPLCRPTTKTSLTMAKKNIEEYYPLVGMTEDLGAFFRLAEYLIPGYFTGGADYFSAQQEALHRTTSTKNRDNIKAETYMVLNDLQVLDRELYQFIRQRFFAMYRKYVPREKQLEPMSEMII